MQARGDGLPRVPTRAAVEVLQLPDLPVQRAGAGAALLHDGRQGPR